jgi:hypothetical protein
VTVYWAFPSRRPFLMKLVAEECTPISSDQ